MKRLITTDSKSAQSGFTILELMIATTVLAVILLLVTVMITGIGNLYYKGVTLSQTQDVTRALVSAATQDIQLNKGAPTIVTTALTIAGNPVTVACEGTARYTYVKNVQIGSGAGTTRHAVWRNSKVSGAACTPMDLTKDLANPTSVDYDASGSELLATKMRLTSLDFTNPVPAVNSSLFQIKASVAYGEDDLLNLSGYTTACKGGTADQFCATARLSGGAVQRIN
jgi:prepilin-type N-terminal cleavage/methylation domain-containing protein